MHELPITRSLLDLVLEHAAKAGEVRVTHVHVVLGDLSGFSPECIRQYWGMLAEGTSAAGATIEFARDPLAFECRGCGSRFEPVSGGFACASCGSRQVRVASGDELRLESIDVESAVATPRGRNGS